MGSLLAGVAGICSTMSDVAKISGIVPGGEL